MLGPIVFVPIPSLHEIDILILPKHKLEAAHMSANLLEQWSLQTAIEEPEEIVGLGKQYHFQLPKKWLK